QAAGVEAAIFMIPDGAVHPGLRAGLTNLLTAGVARIAVTSALPAITGASTRLDGGVQTTNVGNTNAATLGAGGVVGVDALALPVLAAPDVQIVDAGAVRIGLEVQASSVEIAALAITGFGSAPASDLDASILVGASAASVSITRCAIGTSANAFADPGAAARAGGDQVRVIGGDNGVVQSCLIGFAVGTGVSLSNGSNGWQVLGCEIRGNAIGQ